MGGQITDLLLDGIIKTSNFGLSPQECLIWMVLYLTRYPGDVLSNFMTTLFSFSFSLV